MKKTRIISALLFCFLAVSGLNAKKYPVVYDKSELIKDTGKKDFGSTDVIAAVKDMRTGWNLGNTLDATQGTTVNSETSWGMPKTTKAMIDAIAQSGFKTIRIPVSWHNHIIDDEYTIDSEWMARVKEIVDWCIEDGLYVILNTHHDNFLRNDEVGECEGYYLTDDNFEESAYYLTNVWSQICTTFNKGYDNHLIFETLNEPRLAGTNVEWYFDKNNSLCKEAAKNLNELNQIALDTIRASGGNNKSRFVMIPAYVASPYAALEENFKMPKDVKKGLLILSVHMYTPAEFAISAGPVREFTQKHKNELGMTFKRLNEKFVVNGYPVVIGEYGATNKDNLSARVEWFNFFLTYSRKYGMTSCLWDNSSSDPDPNGTEKFGFFNRRRKAWYFPEIIQTIVDCTKE